MSRSRETYSKKEVRNKKEKKRKEKLAKREERREKKPEGRFEDMIAYVDAHGNITDTPPEAQERKAVKAEDIEIGVPKQERGLKPEAVRRGKVSFFNDSKGYGFIVDAANGAKYFFHVSQTEEDVIEGDAVTFETEKGPKGINAVKVRLQEQEDEPNPA